MCGYVYSSHSLKPIKMKKIITFLLAVSVSLMAMGQSRISREKESRLTRNVPRITMDNPAGPVQAVNAVVNSKNGYGDLLGGSRYDMQTNHSVQNRICLFQDGTIGATWIRGMQDPNYNDRGTGYNYFNGTAWGSAPTGRLEAVKTGWPSIEPWNGNGEVIICHQNNSAPLLMETRAVKGTGSWTTSYINPPSGAPGLGWPRLITSGPNNNYMHLLVLTLPVANDGSIYQGLDGALLYYRSLDGGQTWDKPGIILPQLTSSDYDGIGGDDYAWGTAHGDTIYFALGEPYTDTFIMRSTDNGDTWEKIPVLSNANSKIPAGTQDLPKWKGADGALAVEMDHSGIIHLAFGVGGGFIQDGTKYITINYNGLVYWNSTMPMLQDSLDLDTLEAHGQLLGYVADGPNPGDTLTDVPNYRNSLSSFPQISVDGNNNKFFLWSAAAPGSLSPYNFNYHHIYGRAWFNGNATMGEAVDLNEGLAYLYQEFMYESMSKKLKGNNLLLVYQQSEQPGSNIIETTIPFHDVTTQYREIPTATFISTGTETVPDPVYDPVSPVYPNPTHGVSTFFVNVKDPLPVGVEVCNMIGQGVMKIDKGVLGPGNHLIRIDVSHLEPGVYFYIVRIKEKIFVRKVVVG
jgi:hypothetical protein